jgi:uncharacterized OB-fold protein
MAVALKAEFQAYFDRLSAGELAFPICEDCARWHWYPMTLCPHCRSSRLSWRPVHGVGEIWSWTVVRHAFEPDYGDKLPYVVALVCFEDAPGIRLVANIEGISLDELRIGLPVELVRSADGRSPSRPVFGPLRPKPHPQAELHQDRRR